MHGGDHSQGHNPCKDDAPNLHRDRTQIPEAPPRSFSHAPTGNLPYSHTSISRTT